MPSRARKFPYFIILLPTGHTEGAYEALWQNDVIGMEEISSDQNLVMQKVYFEDVEALEHCKRNVEMLVSQAVIIHSGTVDYSDWESFLHGGFEPLRIDPLYIVPAINPPTIPDGLMPVYIIPGRGFGTGGHASTRLALRALTHHMSPGLSVLDVGTGSGILSVAACQLGAKNVFAVDTDVDAVQNARENVERNSMIDRVELAVGSIESVVNGPYNLICANIIAHVLAILFREGMAELIEPGGVIITSGILAGELNELRNVALDYGLKKIGGGRDGKWHSAIFRRT